MNSLNSTCKAFVNIHVYVDLFSCVPPTLKNRGTLNIINPGYPDIIKPGFSQHGKAWITHTPLPEWVAIQQFIPKYFL